MGNSYAFHAPVVASDVDHQSLFIANNNSLTATVLHCTYVYT